MKRLLSLALISIGFIGLFSSCDKDDDLAYVPTPVVAYVTIPSDTTVNAEAHNFIIDVQLPEGFNRNQLESWKIGRPAFYDASVPEDADPWLVADVNPLGGWIDYGKGWWMSEVAYKRGCYLWVSIKPNETGVKRAVRLSIGYNDTECWYIGQCVIWQEPKYIYVDK